MTGFPGQVKTFGAISMEVFAVAFARGPSVSISGRTIFA
jgi:hypothetical protein